jgi:hypothetical protein
MALSGDAGDVFMSADELRAYMTEVEMAKASKALAEMSAAEKAQKALVDRLSQRIDLTPERKKEVMLRVMSRIKQVAADGKEDLLVMQFPASMCTDKGRAINNNDPEWPGTLTGLPRQAFELWNDELKPAGYRLAASIITWPDGMPGDVGFQLSWGKPRTA